MAVKEWTSGNITIKVDYEKCKGRGDCVSACPVEVFAMENGKAIAPKVEDCIECCACVTACPEKAIEHSSC